MFPACHRGSTTLARLALVRHAEWGAVPDRQSDADQAEQPQKSWEEVQDVADGTAGAFLVV